MRDITFWIETNSSRITSNRKFSDKISDDEIDEELTSWVMDYKNRIETYDGGDIVVGEYGWKPRR